MTTTNYRPDIDGLRAVAVLAVVGYHFDFRFLASGFLGVDVFFVISGFVIANSLQKQEASSLKVFLFAFWTRRIKRLFPALAVVVIFGVSLAMITSSVSLTRFTSITGLSSLFGMSNVYFYRNSIDYWGSSTDLNFLTQTWSLGVEEQFYFLLPLLFYISGFGGRHARTSRKRAGKILLSLFISCSLVGFLYLAARNPNAAFYLSPFRFWQLGLGVLLSLLWPSRHVTFRWASLVAPMAMISLLMLFTQPNGEGIAPVPVLVASLTTAILIFSAPKNRVVSLLLTTRPVLYLGQISYSLYLWHWTVLVLFRWLTPLGALERAAALVVSLGLAHLSNRFVEKPFRARAWRRIGGSELATGLLVIGTTTALLATSVVMYVKFRSDPWRDVHMVHADLRCHDPKWTDTPVTDCLTASGNDLPTIYVLGDSHAGNLIPSIGAAFPAVNLRYLTDAALSSAMIEGASALTDGGRVSQILNLINLQVQSQDVVLFAFSRDIFSYVPRNGAPVGFTDYATGSPRVWDNNAVRNMNFESSLATISLAVQRAGARLVLFDGLPKLCSHSEFDVGKVRRPGNPCIGRSADSLADRKGFSTMLHRVANNFQGDVIDAHQFLCPGTECQSVIHGKLWTWDGSPHFLNINSEVLTPFFVEVGTSWFRQTRN